MKKTHTQYRSGLLMGLLSLSTLSSCVNTRRELGMDNISGRNQAQGSNENVEQGVNVEEGRTSPFQDVLKSATKEVAKDVAKNMAWLAASAVVGGVVGYNYAGCPNASSNSNNGSVSYAGCPNASSNSNNESVSGAFDDMRDPFAYKKR